MLSDLDPVADLELRESAEVEQFGHVLLAAERCEHAREVAEGGDRGPEALADVLAGGGAAQVFVAARGRVLSSASASTITPQDLRRSFCSLAGRRGVEPVEAAQITGHSPAVWARFYAFGAVPREDAHGPLAPRSHGPASDAEFTRDVESDAQEFPASKDLPEGGAYRDRTGDLRLAKLNQAVSGFSTRLCVLPSIPLFMRVSAV